MFSCLNKHLVRATSFDCLLVQLKCREDVGSANRDHSLIGAAMDTHPPTKVINGSRGFPASTRVTQSQEQTMSSQISQQHDSETMGLQVVDDLFVCRSPHQNVSRTLALQSASNTPSCLNNREATATMVVAN